MSGTRAGGPRLAAWLCLFAIYIVWGTTYLAIRIVVHEMPPFAAAALRFATAAVVIAGLAFVFERQHGWPSRRQWIDYSIAGLCFLAGGNAGVMWAETRVPSGITALLVAMVPLWVTLLDGFRPGGQRWTTRVWVGVILGLVGVGFVARPEATGGAGHWTGIIVLQVASLIWSLGALYVQSIPRKLPTFSATAVEMVAGAAGLLIESLIVGERLGAIPEASTKAWLGLLYLVVFGAIIGFTAFAYAIHELPASTVGTYAYVNPVVAVVLGHLILHEPLTRGAVIGAAFIIVAVILTTHRAASAPRAEPEAERA